MIASDIRYRLAGETIDSPYPSQQHLLRYGFSRNDNLIKARLSLGVGNRVKAVTDVDLVLYGFSDAKDIDALTLHERIDPYRLEVHAAYVDIYQVLPGLDLRIGRQVVVWGVADQFNPTSVVNTLDLSDPLLFGRALANNMVRADYNPKGDWIFSAVWVPIFRPAELPRTAPVALRGTDRPAPIQEDAIRDTLYQQAQNAPPSQINVLTAQPEPSLSNSQVAVRGAGRVLGQDVSLSYYHGRFGIPQLLASVNHAATGVADVLIGWPKMDLIGADIAGSIAKLAGMGYWVEGALVFPQPVDYALYNETAKGTAEVRFTGGGKQLEYTNVNDKTRFCPQPDRACGAYQTAPAGVRGTILSSTPFLKLTVGGDMSLGGHVYLNVQYVHGFIDEFGTGKAVHALVDPSNAKFGLETPRVEQRIGDYLIGGTDLHMFSDRLLFRLFAVFKVPSLNLSKKDGESYFDDYKFTAVIFPQLIWSVWDGTELTLGAFVFVGDRSTKFGDPAAGASEVFAKAKFAF